MTDFELMDLYRKVSLFGLSDLRKLAPIGDIGYLNGISFYRGKSFGSFLRSTLIDWIYKAYCEPESSRLFISQLSTQTYRAIRTALTICMTLW